MLDKLFMQILDMSITGSVVILVVLLARLLLKKSPKIVSYALWSAVLLRLLCPISIQAPISVMPEITPVEDTYNLTDVPISIAGAGVAAYQAMGDILNGGIGMQHIPTTNTDAQGSVEYVTTDWGDILVLFGQYVWVAGVAVMAMYSAVSYWRLKKRLGAVIHLRENIYIADEIPSPFVIGLIKPKIYLPDSLMPQEQEYIIAHEQHHIRRFDHLIKALAFLALTVHWFNPLVWVAFVLASRDMEMSCDEAVIRRFGPEVRADYAASLLTLATGRQFIGGTPLAFGEGDPKGRIKNLAGWKKPVLWITGIAVVFCAVLAVCLLTDPVGQDEGNITDSSQTEGTEPNAEDATKPTEATKHTKPTEPTVPEEYEIPDGISGIVTYSQDIEELPETYTPQQAANDGCVVMIDGDVAANEGIWLEYRVTSSRGEIAKVRLAEYGGNGQLKRLYELVHISHGHIYRLMKDGQLTEKLYRYLVLDGSGNYDGGHYNMFQVYALTNGNWSFQEGVPYDDSTWNDDAVMVCCNLYQRYDYAPIPEKLQCAEIRNQSGTVAIIWDHHKLEKLMELLAPAEGYCDWPKTVDMGAALILTGVDGTKVEARMMRYSALIEIDGVFYDYAPSGEGVYYIEDMLALFDLTEMP